MIIGCTMLWPSGLKSWSAPPRSAWLKTAAGTLAGALLIGCAALTSPRRECLVTPPPTLAGNKDAGVTIGGEGNCPKEFEACLDKTAVDEVERREGKLKRYAEDAWDLCGAPPASKR